jgi:hypothetical protein
MNSLLACLDAQLVSFPVYVIVQELRKLGLSVFPLPMAAR